MIIKKNYKHIFFDLDNTLWDFEANSAVALKQTFLHYQLDNKINSFDDFHKVYVGHNERLWEAYRKNGISKQELIRLRFQHTFDEFSIREIDPAEFNGIFLGLMPLQKVLIPSATDVLNYLYNKHYQLYIITNGFKEVQEKKLELTCISQFFTRVFISEDIKAQKPSREIFEYALKSSNARKKESIMIGDSWDVDIEGARLAGIDQVFFRTDKTKIGDKPNEFIKTGKTKTLTYTFSINSLSELFTIL